MGPLQGSLLWDIATHLPLAKAQGLDAWSPADLRALPRAAYDDLALVLDQIEAEGKWPQGLRGAIVALLPKKADHAPLAQRPICLLPLIYRLWAAARGALLKEWFREHGHASAWGQGAGRGADTAAWVGAVEAEIAAAQGDAAYGLFVDCEKCYDHVDLDLLVREGVQHGVSRLVAIAVAQYSSSRMVRWAGAVGREVWPTSGIPAGCPLANGLLHLFLWRAMRRTAGDIAPGRLRTYVDDWRILVTGSRRRAAVGVVEAFRVAKAQLTAQRMVVSTTKTVFLASGKESRAALRQAAGPLVGMVGLRVRDLGVDHSLGANWVRPGQTARVQTAVQAARRIARLPLGWKGRGHMLVALVKAQFQWGLDVSGLSPTTLRTLQHWMVFAATGGHAARRAPEVTLALAAPSAWLQPDLHLTFTILRGWAKRLAENPGLAAFILPAWQHEVLHPSARGKPRGPVALLIAHVRRLGWQPVGPANWLSSLGADLHVTNLELITSEISHALRGRRWAEVSSRRADFAGLGEGVDEDATFRWPRSQLGSKRKTEHRQRAPRCTPWVIYASAPRRAIMLRSGPTPARRRWCP